MYRVVGLAVIEIFRVEGLTAEFLGRGDDGGVVVVVVADVVTANGR